MNDQNSRPDYQQDKQEQEGQTNDDALPPIGSKLRRSDIYEPVASGGIGDPFYMGGTITGAPILNIAGNWSQIATGIAIGNFGDITTLEHVSQSIANATRSDPVIKAQLQQLIAQLNAELQNIPADRAGDAEQVARRAEAAVKAATAATPDREDVQYTLSRLTQAAAIIGTDLPAVVPIAEQIAATVGRLIA